MPFLTEITYENGSLSTIVSNDIPFSLLKNVVKSEKGLVKEIKIQRKDCSREEIFKEVLQ